VKDRFGFARRVRWERMAPLIIGRNRPKWPPLALQHRNVSSEGVLWIVRKRALPGVIFRSGFGNLNSPVSAGASSMEHEWCPCAHLRRRCPMILTRISDLLPHRSGRITRAGGEKGGAGLRIRLSVARELA